MDAAGGDGAPGKYVRKEIELSLYDLEADAAETKNLAAANPDVVASLMAFVERAREDLGDSLVKRTGTNVRPAGRIEAGSK
jgi:arylsulfatase A